MTPSTIIPIATCVVAASFFILWMIARGKINKGVKKAVQREAELTAKIDHLENDLAHFREKFSPILSLEVEVTKLTAEVSGIEHNVESVRATYAEKRALLDQLERQAEVVRLI